MAEKNQGVKIDLHNKVHPKTLAEIIKMTYRAFHDKKSMNEDAARSKLKSMPIFVWGSPGCGKSSIVRQAAEDLGIDFIDARLPQMEPCDIKGLPVPDKENHVMNWFINGMWPRGEDTKGILFLDELSACDKSIAVAAYELILDRRLGKLYHIPDGWMIAAAGNLVTDRAVSSTMSSAPRFARSSIPFASRIMLSVRSATLCCCNMPIFIVLIFSFFRYDVMSL